MDSEYELTPEQVNTLMDLQKIIKRPIPFANNIYPNSFGIKIENNYVVGLGLYGIGLNTLPESIGNFTSLQKLFLEHNKLTTLPESIGNFKFNIFQLIVK